MLKLSKNLGPCTVHLEAESQKELFQTLAGMAEVFGEKCCGLCGGTEIVPFWRTASKGNQTFDYPEMVCLNRECRAKLTFGIHNNGKGTLFPHRKLDAAGRPDRATGEYGEHRGWTRYRGEPKGE